MVSDWVYVAGPISNNPNYREDFDRVCAKALGGAVVNPARWETLGRWENYVRLGISVIVSRCNVVLAVNGWEQSRGATIELLVASELGIPVIDEDGNPIKKSRIRRALVELWKKDDAELNRMIFV